MLSIAQLLVLSHFKSTSSLRTSLSASCAVCRSLDISTTPKHWTSQALITSSPSLGRPTSTPITSTHQTEVEEDPRVPSRCVSVSSSPALPLFSQPLPRLCPQNMNHPAVTPSEMESWTRYVLLSTKNQHIIHLLRRFTDIPLLPKRLISGHCHNQRCRTGTDQEFNFCVTAFCHLEGKEGEQCHCLPVTA